MEHRRSNRAIFLAVLLVTSLCLVHDAMAGLLLDLEVKGVYEDNITGSAADIDKQGDFYTITSASAGVYRGAGGGTFLFLRGEAAGYLYREYNDLNAVIVGFSAGAYREFSGSVSGEATLRIKRKQYSETGRSSNSLSGVLGFRQQVLPNLWIKEGYEFEKNIAGSDIFSYEGHLLGLWSGYSISPKTMATISYSYLVRTYEDPPGFRNTFNTFSFGITREVLKKIYVSAGYYRQYNSSNTHETSHADNIYTLGILYSY